VSAGQFTVPITVLQRAQMTQIGGAAFGPWNAVDGILGTHSVRHLGQ